MSDNPEALRRLWPIIEKALGGLVFTADKAGEVAADMATVRAALAQQAATPSGDPAALERVASWLERLPEKPHNLPYWTNGFFANDCRDAAEVARQAATPAPAGWKLVPIEPTPEMIAAWPNGNHGAGHEASIYRAMLLAAPPATPEHDEYPDREAV